MKEIITYVASDGTHFFDKTLCDKYEKTLLSVVDEKGSVIFLNEWWDNLKTDDNIYSRIDNCRYIIVANQEGADFLKLFSDKFLEFPCEIGLWAWNYSLGKFIKVSSSNILEKIGPAAANVVIDEIQILMLKYIFGSKPKFGGSNTNEKD